MYQGPPLASPHACVHSAFVDNLHDGAGLRHGIAVPVLKHERSLRANVQFGGSGLRGSVQLRQEGRAFRQGKHALLRHRAGNVVVFNYGSLLQHLDGNQLTRSLHHSRQVGWEWGESVVARAATAGRCTERTEQRAVKCSLTRRSILTFSCVFSGARKPTAAVNKVEVGGRWAGEGRRDRNDQQHATMPVAMRECHVCPTRPTCRARRNTAEGCLDEP